MIGILNAYHFDPSPGGHQEEYTRLFIDFVKIAFPDEEIRDYKIALGKWPKSVNECQVWFVTGSTKSVYETDPWILRLKQFVFELNQNGKKLIGVCFGHQMIAHALGGKVERSSQGWGLGVKPFEMIQAKPWMNPEQENLALIFSNQDQVTELPPGAELLAKSDFCPHQMFQIGDHILTMQGHPELSVDYLRKRLGEKKQQLSPETYAAAMASLDKKRDSLLVEHWIRHFADPSWHQP